MEKTQIFSKSWVKEIPNQLDTYEKTIPKQAEEEQSRSTLQTDTDTKSNQKEAPKPDPNVTDHKPLQSPLLNRRKRI